LRFRWLGACYPFAAPQSFKIGPGSGPGRHALRAPSSNQKTNRPNSSKRCCHGRILAIPRRARTLEKLFEGPDQAKALETILKAPDQFSTIILYLGANVALKEKRLEDSTFCFTQGN
jgi:hypothetical protein